MWILEQTPQWIRHFVLYCLLGWTVLALKLRRRFDWNTTQCVLCRRAGMNLSRTAEVTGLSISTVKRRLLDVGMTPISMGNPWAAKPNITKYGGYPAAMARNGRQCSLHRACWEAYYGPIHKGHVVHHVNGDKGDFDISNLAAMSPAIHGRVHFSKFAPARYAR